MARRSEAFFGLLLSTLTAIGAGHFAETKDYIRTAMFGMWSLAMAAAFIVALYETWRYERETKR